MILGLALAAAVAGGNLAVTVSPRPVAGRPVQVRATGQVGDTGWLFVFRNRGAACGATVLAERQLHSRARSLHVPIRMEGSFEFRVSYVPRRAGREWVCSYLYATTCDAASGKCGPATGLPPDAGFSRNRVRVKAAPARSGSAATR
jgi:hypothetical protein